MKAFDPKLAWEPIRDEKITSTLTVPAMLQFMLATHDQAAHDARRVHRPRLLPHRPARDRHRGARLRPEPAGEVLIRGPHNMLGYWKRPDANAMALQSGWLHTGDIGTMDEEGFVTMDRMKDILIPGGENVYPAEIENMLLALRR